MRPMPLLLGICVASGSLLAQANCSAGAAPPAALATQTPFAGNNLYGHPGYPTLPGPSFPGFNFLFDLTPLVAIDIDRIDLDFYDAGGLVDLGNGTTVTSPNQVGATVPVTFYIIPATTWVGNELSQALWGALGTGTLTIAGPHADSTLVFSPPINLPAGLWAVALQVPQTTTGPNPGPLHPMLDPLLTQPPAYSDAVLTMANVRFQRESWTNLLASPAHSQNIEIHYTALTGYANWTSFGSGCVAPTAPQLSLVARPVVGTTIDFQATGIQAGTLFNFWMFGFTPAPAGIPLDSFGMPTCNLYLQLGSAIISSIAPVTGGTSQSLLPLPNDPSYSGLVLYGQAAPATGGVNAGGFVASNAVCVAFGLH